MALTPETLSSTGIDFTGETVTQTDIDGCRTHLVSWVNNTDTPEWILDQCTARLLYAIRSTVIEVSGVKTHADGPVSITRFSPRVLGPLIYRSGIADLLGAYRKHTITILTPDT